MPITIKGIRVEAIHLESDVEKGGFKVKEADYSLISSADKVLAKQHIGGYQQGAIALQPSPATQAALEAFCKAYLMDVQTLLGLNE